MSGIPPQPVPLGINIRPIQSGKDKLVVMEISCAFGTVFPHMSPDDARQVAAALTQAADTLSTGLILPGAQQKGLIHP